MSTAPVEPQLDINQHFNDLVRSYAQEMAGASPLPEDARITVLLELPHLASYGRETTVELVYGCTFMVATGDVVLCPPTPRGPSAWTAGVVVALDGKGYQGPVKYVRKHESKKEGQQ
jgi:hypothetical protein